MVVFLLRFSQHFLFVQIVLTLLVSTMEVEPYPPTTNASLNRSEEDDLVFGEYFLPLAEPKPMLIPDDDDSEVLYEIIPDPKSNAKLQWSDETTMMEIPPREIIDYDSEDSDDSYEIEIVEDADTDADFSLEIVDGEVYYVFETEDDISVEDDGEDSMESDSSFESTSNNTAREPLQLPIDMMIAPNSSGSTFHETDRNIDEHSAPSFQDSTVSFHFGELDEDEGEIRSNLVDSDDTFPDYEVASLHLETSQKQPVHDSPKSINIRAEPNGLSCTKGTDFSPKSPIRSISMSPISECEIPFSPVHPVSPEVETSNQSKSILKLCPSSPSGMSQQSCISKKDKRRKDKKKKEKTFTKTYVRADTFDGEHSVIRWEKPSWTETKLKSTGNGESVKSGANLANPITFPKKYEWNHKVVEDEDGEQVEHTGMNAEDLTKKLKELSAKQKEKGMVKLPNLKSKFQKHLKVTIQGAKIREGGDIVKPITKATVDKDPEHHLNKVAKPELLKRTDLGEKVKQGISPRTMKAKIGWERPKWVQAKLQHAESEKKTYEWEKPEWAKRKVNAELEENSHSTRTSCNSPIRKKYEWKKPEWAQPKDQNECSVDSKEKGRHLMETKLS